MSDTRLEGTNKNADDRTGSSEEIHIKSTNPSGGDTTNESLEPEKLSDIKVHNVSEIAESSRAKPGQIRASIE